MPHDYRLPPEYRARAVAREARPHSLEQLEPSQTALLVVDMQRYFIEPPFSGACPMAQSVVPNVNTLAAALREAGGAVVWLQMEAPAETADWSALRERYTPETEQARWSALQPGKRGFELWPQLDTRPDDWFVVKTRYSAFIPGSSDLDERLKAADVDTLLVAGVATNACCESTARDAMMLDYRVAMISDACAAPTDEEHAAALNNFYLFFGDVRSTEGIVPLLAQSGI